MPPDLLRRAPPFSSCVYADLEIETAGMTRLVVVFTRFTSSTNSPIQLIVEDQQTNRLRLDFLSPSAQIGPNSVGRLFAGGPSCMTAPSGPRSARARLVGHF